MSPKEGARFLRAHFLGPVFAACLRGESRTTRLLSSGSDNISTSTIDPGLAAAEDEQLRLALNLIPADTREYGRFWATPDGTWLHQRVEERIGRPLVLWVGRVYGPRYEPSDVSNTAVDVLSSRFIVASLVRADDQWAYLATILKRELIQQVGGFFRSDADEPEGVAPDTTAADDVQGATVREAVKLTAALLEPHTPASVVPHLEEMVFYFAERGHTSLSRLHTSASQDPELLSLGLAPHQIMAVANVILGSRPDHGHNSVLGAYLRDPGWAPWNSAPHVRALQKYAARVSARTTQLAMAS